MGAPGQAAPAPSAQEPAEPSDMPPPEPAAEPEPAFVRPAPARTEAEAPVEPDAAMEPMISRSGNRLRLSLSYVSCMVVFIALVLLMVVVFALGRHSVRLPENQASAPSSDQSTEQAGIARAPAAGGTSGVGLPKLPPPARVQGKYYLIVQVLRGKSDRDMETAQNIVKFLDEKGLPADVGTFRSGGTEYYGVWSLTPFDSAKSSDAIAFAKRIDSELGPEYFKKYGEYNFMQRKKRGGELEPYYVKPPPPK